MPGAGRKPDAEPKKPRAVRLSDRQAVAFQEMGGTPWLQGQCNLWLQRVVAPLTGKPCDSEPISIASELDKL